MAKSTILHPWLRGVIEITGEHDTGKTLAMLQTVRDFTKTAFIDDDIKGEGTVKQMTDQGVVFDMYKDLARERAKLKGAATADEMLNEIVFPLMDEITSTHHDVIIFDTWRIVYQSLRGHVERNQSKYAGVVRWQGSSQIIQGLISKVARMLERDFINRLKNSCDLLILSHHVKDHYVENVNVGVIPESSATFDEICNMRIWLRRNPQSKVPVMLFLKRPNVPVLVPGKGLRASNIVPEKVTPTDKHESIWEAIAEYQAHPIESRKPRADETPSKEELAVISGTITTEMRDYVKQMMAYNAQIEKELSQAFAETTGQDVQVIRARASEPSQEGSGSTQETIPEGYPANAVQLLARASAELGLTMQTLETALGKSFAEINKDYKAEYWTALQKAKVKDGKQNSKPPAARSKK